MAILHSDYTEAYCGRVENFHWAAARHLTTHHAAAERLVNATWVETVHDPVSERTRFHLRMLDVPRPAVERVEVEPAILRSGAAADYAGNPENFRWAAIRSLCAHPEALIEAAAVAAMAPTVRVEVVGKGHAKRFNLRRIPVNDQKENHHV